MLNLDRVGDNIHKKLSLQDYNTPKQQDDIAAKQEKVRLTIYLTPESLKKINEMCSKNVLENGRPDKSALINKAIDLLYEDVKGSNEKK